MTRSTANSGRGIRNVGMPWDERVDVGERVLTHNEDEHRARYLWAAERVSGRVLDVACGAGYGSRILAGVCEITGIDRDETAIATAQARVPNAVFQAAEVPPIPYVRGRFEHAVCFETVEHIEHDRDFIVELRRVVTAGGHLLISTPNRALSSPNDLRPLNPYHVREYLLPELQGLLRAAGFEQVQVFFQRKGRQHVPEYLANAVMKRVPWLCQPGRWWDRLGHGSGEVENWSADVTHPALWVLDCS